jgi:hypothetical protein
MIHPELMILETYRGIEFLQGLEYACYYLLVTKPSNLSSSSTITQGSKNTNGKI